MKTVILCFFLLSSIFSGAQIIGPHRKVFLSSVAAVTFVQNLPGTFTSAGTMTRTSTFAAPNVAGDGYMICGVWGVRAGGTTGNTLTGVTDSSGDTFTISSGTLKTTLATTDYAEIGEECATSHGIAAHTGNVVTCTFSAGVGGYGEAGCFGVEISPFTTVGPLAAVAATAANPSAGSVTTTVNGSFGVAVVMQDDGLGTGTVFTSGSGWTLNKQGGASNSDAGLEYQAQATAGSLVGNFTTSFSAPYVISVITVHN
jgi:hypothetical protein